MINYKNTKRKQQYTKTQHRKANLTTSIFKHLSSYNIYNVLTSFMSLTVPLVSVVPLSSQTLMSTFNNIDLHIHIRQFKTLYTHINKGNYDQN